MRYWFILLCIICFGCGSSNTQDLALPTLIDFPTETATEPATDIPPSDTPTSTSTVTETISPTSTNTITSVPSETFTPTVTVTPIPTISPTSERDLIGEEVALFTILIEVFDPPLLYEVVVDEIYSKACVNGACNLSTRYRAGDVIEVLGLACPIGNSNSRPYYRIYEEKFFGSDYAYVSPTSITSDTTVIYIDGDDPALNYSCG